MRASENFSEQFLTVQGLQQKVNSPNSFIVDQTHSVLLRAVLTKKSTTYSIVLLVFTECAIQQNFRQSFVDFGQDTDDRGSFGRRQRHHGEAGHGPVSRRQSAGQRKIDAKFEVS